MMKITHYINLPGLGGIERLFLAFITSTKDSIDHHILLKGRAMPPLMAQQMATFPERLISYKRWGRHTIPGWPRIFRKLLLQRRLAASSPSDILLVWSQLNADDIADVYQGQGAKIIHYEHGSAWLSSPSIRRRAYLDRVDGIICASEACARMLTLRWGVPEAKLCVIKNPLLPDFVPSVQVEKRFRTEGRPWQLGTAGRLVPVKGHYIAIETVAKLNQQGLDCRLLVAGDGPLRDALKAFADVHGIGNKVQFLGFVEDMGGFYQAVDVFLLPSLREPFGLVSLEAAAWGCPVVAAWVDGVPETLLNNVSGCLVLPNMRPAREMEVMKGSLPAAVYNPLHDRIEPPLAIDSREMADAVAALLSDPERLRRMSLAGMELVRKHYAYDAYLIKMNALLGGVVSRRPGEVKF